MCSAVAFLSHHSHATSEQQAEKPPCLSLSGRVAAADLSHVSVPSHSLEGLVCSQSYSYPFLGCSHHLCTPVIFLCREVACFDTPFPSNILSSFCAGLCSQLSARHHCRQLAATSDVTSGSVAMWCCLCGGVVLSFVDLHGKTLLIGSLKSSTCLLMYCCHGLRESAILTSAILH